MTNDKKTTLDSDAIIEAQNQEWALKIQKIRECLNVGREIVNNDLSSLSSTELEEILKVIKDD